MSYAAGRLIHDADSHLMEPVDCLDPYFDKRLLARFLALPQVQALRAEKAGWIDEQLRQQKDEGFRAEADENILLRKGYEAHGAWWRSDRPHTMDLLGFASQLVFTTHCLGNFGLDQGDDMELCYGAADAHNRMMTDFCSIDRRLLPVAYVPLEDFGRSLATAKLAIELGAKALMVPSRCPQKHSPSHIALDPVWALAQEAGLPVVLHVAGRRS